MSLASCFCGCVGCIWGLFFQKINLIVREGDVGFVHNPWIDCVDFSGFLGLGLG